jgi:DNA modification methylase
MVNMVKANILIIYANEQKIIYPFAGVGSEVIGGYNAGFKNWVACEINSDYVDIANVRITHWLKGERGKEGKND